DLSRWIKDSARYDDTGVNTRFALAAARQALEDAGLLEEQHPAADRARLGTYFGSGEGVQDFHNLVSLIGQNYRRELRRVDVASFVRGGMTQFHAGRESEQELHTTSAHVANEFALDGPNYNCLTACAASSQAVREAAELIRHGDADVMLSGGSH